MTASRGEAIRIIDELAEWCHSIAVDKGWWDKPRNDGELIALMHSELSEALEGLRHGNPSSEHIPEFTAVEEEMADVVIRVLDAAAGKGWRLGEVLAAKIETDRTMHTQLHSPLDLAYGIDELAQKIHSISESEGGWNETTNDGELIAAMHVELSKAYEVLRGEVAPASTLGFTVVEEKMADLLIRIMEACSGRDWRLGLAIVEKIRFNSQRPSRHGKEF